MAEVILLIKIRQKSLALQRTKDKCIPFIAPCNTGWNTDESLKAQVTGAVFQSDHRIISIRVAALCLHVCILSC